MSRWFSITGYLLADINNQITLLHYFSFFTFLNMLIVQLKWMKSTFVHLYRLRNREKFAIRVKRCTAVQVGGGKTFKRWTLKIYEIKKQKPDRVYASWKCYQGLISTVLHRLDPDTFEMHIMSRLWREYFDSREEGRMNVEKYKIV